MTTAEWLRVIGYFVIVLLSAMIGSGLLPTKTKSNIGKLWGISEFTTGFYFFVLASYFLLNRIGDDDIVKYRDIVFLVLVWAMVVIKACQVYQFQKVGESELNGD